VDDAGTESAAASLAPAAAAAGVFGAGEESWAEFAAPLMDFLKTILRTVFDPFPF
jgi:hypothetical protein